MRHPFSSLLRRAAPLAVLGLLLTPPAQPAHAQLEPEQAKRAFADAYARYADRLFAQAADAFAAFRADYPDHPSTPEALYYQAEATLAVGRVEQAVVLFDLFEARYPAHPLAGQAQLALGKYFYDTEDYEQAVATLQAILDADPSYETAAKALYWMGESLQQLGRTDEALETFQRITTEYRWSEVGPLATYAIAYTEVRRAAYDDAARAFEQLAARYPDSDYARNIGLALAEVYYELSDYPRVVNEVLRRLDALGPEARERATFLLAEAYNQLRDSENAIIYYRRFTESNPESPYYRRALYGLGWNYHFENAYEWAADQFALVREGHNDDLAFEATYYEAVNRKLSGQAERAIDLFQEALARRDDAPLSPHAAYERAVLYYERGEWENANEALADLIRRYPDAEMTPEALDLRGNVLISLGEFDEALDVFDEAIERDATAGSMRDDLIFQKAWLQYRAGQYQEAAEAFLALYDEGASDPRRQGDALFWAAESAYQVGDLDRGARLFNQYLTNHQGGTNVEAAHYALGWTHFKQGRYGEAAASFERFLEDYQEGDTFVPYRTDALLRLADSYYALKRYSDAIRVYERVADENGEDYALYQIGQAAYNAGDFGRAADSFQELLEEYRDSEWREETQFQLGFLFFTSQNYDAAVEAYEALIDRYPRDPLAAKAQYGIGDALYNAGQLDEAVDAYQGVLNRYPNSPFAADAASSIQYALFALDQPERAEEIIDAFAAANPNSPVLAELRFRQAEAKYQSGLFDEAQADFERFAREQGDAPELRAQANYYLGEIATLQRNEAQAERYLRRVLERPEGVRAPDASRRLGQIYLDDERYNDALSIYRQMERLRQDDPRLVAEARYGQGAALLGLGRIDEAETLLQDALEASPEGPASIPTRLGLARVYAVQGREAEAIQTFRRIISESPDEVGAEALYRLGELLLARGDARQAIDELGRMPTLFPDQPTWLARGYLVQARAFDRLGNRGDAVRLYDLIIAEFSDTPYAREAQREKSQL